MTTQEIARYIHERRLRASPIILPGEAIAIIGSEGLQEALDRRWLVPDHDSGYLQVTGDMARVAEITETAAAEPVVESTIENASAGLVMEHARRDGRGVIHEIAAPATGKPAPGYTPTTPTTTPAAAAAAPAAVNPTAPRQVPANIGDDVTVAEEGRTYAGKVQSRDPQGGGVRISFGPDQRPPVDRSYRDDEIRLTNATT